MKLFNRSDVEKPEISQQQSLEWEEIKHQIDTFLVDVLLKIEWHYGEGRAPYQVPAIYYMSGSPLKITFNCELKLDFCDDEMLVYTAPDPPGLLQIIRSDINEKFAPK